MYLSRAQWNTREHSRVKKRCIEPDKLFFGSYTIAQVYIYVPPGGGGAYFQRFPLRCKRNIAIYQYHDLYFPPLKLLIIPLDYYIIILLYYGNYPYFNA